jgi:molybdate transport system permease protein
VSQFDFRPLAVSLRTSTTATVIVFALGVGAAWRSLSLHARTKAWLDSLFMLPMVLPPTVVGYFLLLIFGRSTGVGDYLAEHGVRLVFSWPATVIAASVVSFPLMYRTVRAAFEQVDADMMDAARTLGLSEWEVFRRVVLPLARPGVTTGTMLSFARALGEFGATLFVAGNLPGVTQTMPIAVYFAWAAGDMRTAGVWVTLIAAMSLAATLGVNEYFVGARRCREIGLPG